MSKNFTEGGDLPIFLVVLIDELEDNIDFAGAGREREEVEEDTDGARRLVGLTTRWVVWPKSTVGRSGDFDRLGRIRLDQKFRSDTVSPLTLQASGSMHSLERESPLEMKGISGRSSSSEAEDVSHEHWEDSLSKPGVGGVQVYFMGTAALPAT